MLQIDEALQILKTYNIYSKKYEPTIYQNNNEIGLCLDIKDSLFGYLTRIFLSNSKDDLNDFLRKYFWYKENHKKYNIKLKLDDYYTKTPKIIYEYQNVSLSLDEMLNMKNFIEKEKEEKKEEEQKKQYLESIRELTNYLMNFKALKENIKQEKNKLKTEENDLKFELLQQLTTYYGREKVMEKKVVTLDFPSNIDNTSLIENLKNIENKSIKEIEDYLRTLINIIKAEELDEKNLVNIYSNSVYQYNINILKKQIDFVKSKINAEKNFNLKGSKIHNIDEELKSFLRTNVAPTKIEDFLNENKQKIEDKFNSITNILSATKIITGHQITNNSIENLETAKIEQPNLLNEFKSLPPNTQANLILYNSIYKPICNYIIDNNYPPIESIITSFDFNHYYQELEEIVFNENNNHYLINYFKEINFKDLTNYIHSLIMICKDLENTNFKTNEKITLFAEDNQHKYLHLTNIPASNKTNLVEASGNLLFIPTKLEIDWDNLEINLTESTDYYTKDKLVKEEENITLAKYNKKDIEKDDIIITTDLILESEITFTKSHLEGENYG